MISYLKYILFFLITGVFLVGYVFAENSKKDQYSPELEAITCLSENTQSGTCSDMGCTGGDLNCYSPPGGGMCYTGRKVEIE